MSPFSGRVSNMGRERGGPPVFATLNPLDKDPSVVLTGGDLVCNASLNATWRSVRATVGVSSGKHYFEVLKNSPTLQHNMIGVGTKDAVLASFCGVDVYGWGWYDNSDFWHAAVTLSNPGYGPGDYIGVAVDMDAGKLWWSINGVWQKLGNPATGANPVYTGLSGKMYPMMSVFRVGSIIVCNFGASAFVYPAPAGFSPGIYGVPG